MIETLDSDSLVAEILLSASDGRIICVVEGDIDEFFLETHLPDEFEINIINGRGKGRIEQVLTKLLALPESLVILLDRDFDLILGKAIQHKRVVYTDRYNLEASLLGDPATFDRLWSSHIKGRRLNPCSSEEARDRIIALAKTIGDLRLLCQRLSIDIDLADLPIVEMVDVDDQIHEIKIDDTKLLEISLKRSKKSAWVARRRQRKSIGMESRAIVYIKRNLLAQHKTLGDLDTMSGHDMSRALNVIMSKYRRRGIPSASDLELQSVVHFRREESPTVSVLAELDAAIRMELGSCGAVV